MGVEVLSTIGGKVNAGGPAGNVLSSSNSVLVSSRVAGDTNDRFQITADGTLTWGNGTQQDVILFRQGAEVLQLGSPGNPLCALDINISTGAAWLHVGSGDTTSPTVILQQKAAQSADVLQVRGSDGTTVLFNITQGGGVHLSNAQFVQMAGTAGWFIGDAPNRAGATNSTNCLSFGTGAPNNASGANGDIYLRADGGALTTIYQKRAGAWVGIV